MYNYIVNVPNRVKYHKAEYDYTKEYLYAIVTINHIQVETFTKYRSVTRPRVLKRLTGNGKFTKCFLK